jgi:hypothetical protein
LDPVAPGAPADIVKALVDQKQSPASGGAMVQGQLIQGALVGVALIWAALKSKSRSFVLNLPDQPERTLNSAHPQTFGGVSVITMAHGIDQGFMEAQFQLRLELPAGHRFEQQLHQGSQLEGGWRDEI